MKSVMALSECTFPLFVKSENTVKTRVAVKKLNAVLCDA